MDLDNPAVLFSGKLIATIGHGLFIYGRKAPDTRSLVAGIALSVLPFMAHSMLALWGITSICALTLYISRRMA